MKGVLKGLGVTLSTALRRPVTVQFPEKKHGLPVRARSFPVLLWDFNHDEPYCTGCMLCVRNCPVECMTAVMRDNPNYALGLSNRRKGIEKFWIDYGRCMRCNICVEVCNFEAIAMDNTWDGHAHAAYDRRDLHQDLDDLTRESREGRLPNPFNPADDMAATVARLQGKEIPAPSMSGARPQARQAQIERVAHGEGAAIREREPDPAVLAAAAAAAATAGGDDELAGLSEKKIRAKRMRAEKEARGKALAEGTDPEAAAAAARAEFDAMLAGAAAPKAAATPEAAVGAKGDANSPAKIRARRMRAEREAREKAVAEGRDPDAAAAEAAAAFDASLGFTAVKAPVAAPAAAAAPAPAATPAVAVEGDLTSNKARARRMREEKEARAKAIAEGSDPDAAVAEVRRKWGVQ